MDTMYKLKLKKGFTLVELLVVIAIIGILATLLLLQLNVGRGKARDTKRVADVTQLRTAVELYYDENGSYPATISDANIGKFMASGVAPLDPTTGVPYGYGTSGGNTLFQIWAELENYNAGTLRSDSDIDASGWTGGPGTGGTDGTDESNPCTAGDTSDCVFDLGID